MINKCLLKLQRVAHLHCLYLCHDCSLITIILSGQVCLNVHLAGSPRAACQVDIQANLPRQDDGNQAAVMTKVEAVEVSYTLKFEQTFIYHLLYTINTCYIPYILHSLLYAMLYSRFSKF